MTAPKPEPRTGKRRGRTPGTPDHVPTPESRRQVEMLIGYGLVHDAIAAVIGVSDETLRKHYRAELNHGKAKVVAQVANSLVKKALSERPDAINAAKFYLERQGNWTETKNINTTIKDARRMTDDELLAYLDDADQADSGEGVAASPSDQGKPH